MRIMIIGQTTLHKGRMEYGNIGNYYIVDPFFRGLRNIFPNAEIITTLQMTDEFCQRMNISCLPLETYYAWDEHDLSRALQEFAIAELYNQTGTLVKSTHYIDEVLKSDLIIDFSGDMWGDNAVLAGSHRFLIGLIKDRVAQLIGKKTFMLIGSPGPFDNTEFLEFAKQVYKNFDFVTNREPHSKVILRKYNFDLQHTSDTVCPSFIFNQIGTGELYKILSDEDIIR